MNIRASRWAAVRLLVLAFMGMTAHPVIAAEPARDVRVLVVMSATTQPNHVFVTGMKFETIGFGRVFGKPLGGRSRVEALYTRVSSLNNSFVSATSGYDRHAVVAEAFRDAFAERSALFEITATADARKYLKGTAVLTLTDAVRAEGFDFVLALHDDFVGIATLDWLDADEGLMTPAYDLSYHLHDAATGEVRAQGKVSSSGYLRQPAQKAASDPALFTYLWPYLCTLNATAVVNDLLRSDHLHAMAGRVGRGGDLPPVAAKIEDFRQRLEWKLAPARGWHERRGTDSSRVLEPRNESAARTLRMTIDVDFLIPELGQQVSDVSGYLPIYDRTRLRQAPKAGPLEPFIDIAAPGYSAYRFLGQAGEHNLVFFKTRGDAVMRIFTVSIAGDFDQQYPRVRSKLESMLAESEISVATSTVARH